MILKLHKRTNNKIVSFVSPVTGLANSKCKLAKNALFGLPAVQSLQGYLYMSLLMMLTEINLESTFSETLKLMRTASQPP